jgi:hypothetical protein
VVGSTVTVVAAGRWHPIDIVTMSTALLRTSSDFKPVWEVGARLLPARPVATQQDGQKAATISIVSGALGLTLIPLVGAVVAIIAGHLARRTLPPGVEGRRLATVGAGLGYLGLVAPLALIVLGGDPVRELAAETRCQQALLTEAPFTACSVLIGDVSLAAGVRRLDSLPATQRLDALGTALKESALCRSEPRPLLCALDASAAIDERRRLTVEGLERAMRMVQPETKAALEAQLPRQLP